MHIGTICIRVELWCKKHLQFGYGALLSPLINNVNEALNLRPQAFLLGEGIAHTDYCLTVGLWGVQGGV